MFHTLQTLSASLSNGVSAHLDQWVGWAALIAGALFGFSGSSLWLPLLVALIINPMPYGIVPDLFYGRYVALNTIVSFTLIQALLAYAGFLAGRLATRFR